MLDKITVNKLFKLSPEGFDEYHNTLKNLVPKPEIKGHQANDIYELSFSEVSWLKTFIKDTSFENFLKAYELVFGISENLFLKADVVEFYHSFNWLQNEILELIEGESALSSEPDEKWKDAGIEDLNVFGELNTLITIGEKYGVPPHEVEKWSYNLVFTYALHNKMNSDVNKRYSEIINKPNGNS